MFQNSERSPSLSFGLSNLTRKDGDKVEVDSITFDLVEDTVDYSTENKCVLILIEALHHKDRYEQVNTFFQAVENSIDEIVNNIIAYTI